MSPQKLSAWMLTSVIMVATCYGDELANTEKNAPKAPPEVECTSPYQNHHVGIRHNEARGVGYKKGYTTLEGFFLSDYFGNTFLPFLDLRGHVFDNGKFAGNAGIGARSLLSQINHYVGAYLYYDVRSEDRLTINQLSPGLELVGKRMEYRVNAYFPVGKKKSRRYGTEFDTFEGNSLFLKRKQKDALSGVDGEVGVHFFTKNTSYDLFGGISPYYLWGPHESAWGGKARLTGSYKQYVTLEIAGTYDHLFKGTLQGSVALRLPFGPKLTRKSTSCSPTQDRDLLQTRAVQSPYRFEIPMIKKHKSRTIAINPLTGAPYTFWFVNNTSHSLGTFESPFSTLVDAENASAPGDVIYVFSGDGTTNGMSMGIVLQNQQKLFGAGIPQTLQTTLGTVQIPQMSPQLPLIGDTNASSIIIGLANGNEVSGINLLGSMENNIDVGGGPINGASIHDNIIQITNSSFAGAGVVFIGTGLFLVNNNQFIASPGEIPISVALNSGNSSVVISGNTIEGIFNLAIALQSNSGSVYDIEITRNVITAPTGAPAMYTTILGSGQTIISQNTLNYTPSVASIRHAIEFNYTAPQTSCLIIEGNQISTITDEGIFIATSPGAGLLNATVANNSITTTGAGANGVIAAAATGSTLCLSLQNNTATVAPTSFGYQIAPSGSTGTLNLEPPVGNIGTFAPTVGPVTPVSAGTCSCGQ